MYVPDKAIIIQRLDIQNPQFLNRNELMFKCNACILSISPIVLLKYAAIMIDYNQRHNNTDDLFQKEKIEDEYYLSHNALMERVFPNYFTLNDEIQDIFDYAFEIIMEHKYMRMHYLAGELKVMRIHREEMSENYIDTMAYLRRILRQFKEPNDLCKILGLSNPL